MLHPESDLENKTEIKSTARNLWFRLLHNKAPAKSALRLILKLPYHHCSSCGSEETASNPLFIFPTHFEIWRNFLSPSAHCWACKRSTVPSPPLRVVLLDSNLQISYSRLLRASCPLFGAPIGIPISMPSPLKTNLHWIRLPNKFDILPLSTKLDKYITGRIKNFK